MSSTCSTKLTHLTLANCLPCPNSLSTYFYMLHRTTQHMASSHVNCIHLQLNLIIMLLYFISHSAHLVILLYGGSNSLFSSNTIICVGLRQGEHHQIPMICCHSHWFLPRPLYSYISQCIPRCKIWPNMQNVAKTTHLLEFSNNDASKLSPVIR